MKLKVNIKLIATLLALTFLGLTIGSSILIKGGDNAVFNIGGFSNTRLGDSKTREEKVNIEEISKITIINSVGELIIELHDEDLIEVVYDAFEKSILKVEQTSKGVRIEGKLSPRGSVNNLNTSLTPVVLHVKLPQSYADILDVKNGVGYTVIEMGEYEKLTAKTGVGDMSISFSSLNDGSFTADVGVGNLTVMLPEDKDVRVKASTGIGNVSNSANFDNTESNSKFIAHSFEGIMGQGRARIKLQVGTGDISIQ